MKIFIKILLFVLTSLVTNVNVVSAVIPFINIQKETSPLSFHKEITKSAFRDIENDFSNCCQNEQDLIENLVDYRDWGKGVEVVVAKGENHGLYICEHAT